ncbi:MAG: hypothetical protein R3B48_14965 [Kofleriaceae bacterium]
MDPLAHVLELLADARSVGDRAAALALTLAELDPVTPLHVELSRLLARRHHVIVRGGLPTLVREVRSEPAGTGVRVALEARSDVEPVRVLRRGSTRPRDDGRLRTLETGGSNVGGVAFSPDGAHLYTFVWGSVPWDDEGPSGSRVQQWRVDNGELVRQAWIGQFREESGSFAISPDGRTLAVRCHRALEIYDLHAWPGQGRPPRRHKLEGCEGPYAISFLDAERVVADDSSRELVLWSAVTGERLAAAASIGWHGHAVTPGAERLLIGGCLPGPPMIGAHALPSLEPDGCFVAAERGDGARVRTEVIARSPSGQRVVTGDSSGAVTLWATRQLRDGARISTPRDPRPVLAHLLGRHERAVTAAAFVDEQRLLTADATGVVLDWRLEDVAPALDVSIDPALDPALGPCARAAGSPRRLLGHRREVTGVAVHPRGHLAATSAEDGLVLLWDLRGDGAATPGPVPPMRQRRSLRPHPDGVEVITDGVAQVVARPPHLRAPTAGPIVPQDPELPGVHVGPFAIVPVDDPGPPQLRVLHGDKVVDVIELDDHCGGLCALDAESFALVEGDGHVSFWGLHDAGTR